MSDSATASSSATDRVALSVVAPCYNEDEVLREFHRRTSAVCQAITDDHELVLVDDGSRDDTWKLMQELAAADPHVVAVKLSRNHGHQLALTAGLNVCRGERILIIDADLQDQPELLPEMLKMMDEEHAGVVYGQRRHRTGESAFKLWTASAFYRVLNRLSDTPIPMDTGDFRLMTRQALDVLNQMPERHRFVRGMVSWIGFKQVPFLFNRDSRFAGETKYPLKRMVKLAMDGLVGFSTWPVKLALLMSGVAALFAAVCLLITLIALFVSASAAWPFLFSVIGLLGAAQFFLLAMYGEYLVRTHQQTLGRPLFVIERIQRGKE
jgi:glycosyltransferase involved in cell wall biosynthesis